MEEPWGENRHNTAKVRGKLRQYIQTGGDQGKTWGTQVNEQDATVEAKLNTEHGRRDANINMEHIQRI